ncbi:MAG: hypothetical protein HC888_07425 [Candidatus Competibacteraceae bacterium]|nr:hypothetical protein [Candidatus Competibacteraceae bacterium]
MKKTYRTHNAPFGVKAYALVGRLLCWLGWHDWRYASNYRRGGMHAGTPKEISRARCQRCDERKWEPDNG